MGAYSKLKIKVPTNVEEITFNGETIKVKQYLPVDKKLELIGKVISMSADENRFYNVGKLDILLNIQILKYYTDLTFTESKEEKVTELYDEIISSGLIEQVLMVLPRGEQMWINKVMMETVEAIYKYQNSALGIMDALGKDYSNLGIEATDIQKALSNPENLTLVKDILTKLG